MVPGGTTNLWDAMRVALQEINGSPRDRCVCVSVSMTVCLCLCLCLSV